MPPKAQNRKSLGTCGSSPTITKMDKFLKSPQYKTRTNQKGPKESKENVAELEYLEETIEGEEMRKRSDLMEEKIDSVDKKLTDILRAVQHSNQALSDLSLKMSVAQADLVVIKDEMNKVREKVKGLQVETTDLRREVDGIKKRVDTMEKEKRFLQEKVTEMEDRSRRANIRVIGFPEGSEKDDPVGFIQKWLLEVYGTEEFSAWFAVERAHRVPGKPPPVGAPPRAMVVKLLNSRDRDIIFRKKRFLPSIEYNGNKISIYPDYSRATQMKRGEFRDIKKRLAAADIKYSLLYPTRLRVVYSGQVQVFMRPDEALEWIDRQGIGV